MNNTDHPKPLDFEAWIALQIIKHAASEKDAKFFRSDWYHDLLTYLSYFFPGLEDDMLPAWLSQVV